MATAVVGGRGGGRGRRRTAAAFSPERHQHILTTLRHDGRIDAAALAAVLEVSTETVRKDLIGLEARGLLQRVHGGAVPVGGHSFEPEVSTRTEYAEEKRRIAAAAVAHVPRSGSVLVDAGSTTAELAAVFPQGRDLTVFTNALTIAMTLATKDGLTVVPLGGQLRRPTSATVGAWTCRALEEINVDVAFLGTNGIDFSRGLTTPDPAEAHAKSLMVRAAATRVLLVDRSKFDRVSLVRHASLDEIDLIITDAKPSSAQLKVLRAAGVRLERV